MKHNHTNHNTEESEPSNRTYSRKNQRRAIPVFVIGCQNGWNASKWRIDFWARGSKVESFLGVSLSENNAQTYRYYAQRIFVPDGDWLSLIWLSLMVI